MEIRPEEWDLSWSRNSFINVRTGEEMAHFIAVKLFKRCSKRSLRRAKLMRELRDLRERNERMENVLRDLGDRAGLDDQPRLYADLPRLIAEGIEAKFVHLTAPTHTAIMTGIRGDDR